MAEKAKSQEKCLICGKRIVDNTHAGSMTSYFFQSLNCNCQEDSTAAKFLAHAPTSTPTSTASSAPTSTASSGPTTTSPPASPPIPTPLPARSAKTQKKPDFCKRCGLRSNIEERPGSITSFLFQDIRCKCTAEELFAAGAMSQKLRRLKQLSADTFADDQADDIDLKFRPSSKSKKSINLAKRAIIGGTYRIIRMLGSGGMGEVYLAEHLFLNKRCALKVIPPDQVTEIGWLRFQNEAKSIARLDHINLVKVSDLGIHESCLPYYAMEYVDGRTMSALLQEQGPMPLKTALAIFSQICDGLEYSHKHNIVHRDLKPANIMLSKLAEGKIAVKVLDFGLVKLTHDSREKQSLTSAGEQLGSPFYMSPEQCEGDRIDRRTDIYSLGCTLFECLVGRPPFDDSITAVIVRNHLLTDPPSLESIVGAGVFPDAIEIILAKTLRKNPVERYQSMAELKSDLIRVQQGKRVQPYYVNRKQSH